MLKYEIYDPRRQLDLTNLVLNGTDNCMTIGIKSPGLSRDLPFGSSVYNFAIRVNDENGAGVSSYVPVDITVLDKNNKAPIPTVKFYFYHFLIYILNLNLDISMYTRRS